MSTEMIAEVSAPAALAPAPELAVKKGGRVPGVKTQSKTSRCGLRLSVSRICGKMRADSGRYRVSPDAAVEMTAALEYMIDELLQGATSQAKERRRTRITNRDIKMAIEADSELSKVTLDRGVIIPRSGVAPNILPVLLPKKRKSAGSSTATASANAL